MENNQIKYICKFCGKEYEPNQYSLKYNRVSKFCSHLCGLNYWKVQQRLKKKPNIKLCIICGKEFIARSKNSKFCSKKCSNKNYKRNNSVLKKCKFCNNDFLSFGNMKYCSQKCANICHINKRPKAKFIEFTCSGCGKKFKINEKDHRIKNNLKPKYCSKECMIKCISINRWCQKCGKPVKKGLKYCSKECRLIEKNNHICIQCGNKYNGKNLKFCKMDCYVLHKKKNAKTLKQAKIYSREYHKEYRRLNREKINEQIRQKMKNDPIFRMKRNVRKIINNSFRRRNQTKSKSSKQLLGCSVEFFVNYIESKFLDGMSCENYGEWQIDHIIPLFTANTIEDIEKLCHYTNLQPLWREDNLIKRSTDYIKFKKTFKKGKKEKPNETKK